MERAMSDKRPLQIDSVGFATGRGRLVRRPDAVLFDPTGENPKLASGFDDASTDADAIGFVIDSLIAADLQAAPFAIVDWSAGLRLVVFGDVAVQTSCPTAPAVSGGASETWVEHRVHDDLLADQASVQVWAGDAPEPGTNLRLGIAACAGFRLDLMVDRQAPTPDVSPAEPPTSEPPTPESPTPEPPTPEPVVEVGSAPSALESVAEPPTPEPPPEPPTPEPVVAVVAEVAAPASEDPFAVTEPESAPVAPVEPTPLLEFEPTSSELPTPTPGPSTGQFASPKSDTLNTSDDELAELDPPEAPTLAAPSFGILHFDEFPDVILTGPIVIGRRPSSDDDHELVIVDHPEVSRNHASVVIDSWAVTLRDLGSRNGTWVASPNGGELRRLEPDEQHILLDGTTVHLGSADVRFIWQSTPL